MLYYLIDYGKEKRNKMTLFIQSDGITEAIRFHEHLLNVYLTTFGIILAVVGTIFTVFQIAANKKFKRMYEQKDELETLLRDTKELIPVLRDQNQTALNSISEIKNHIPIENKELDPSNDTTTNSNAQIRVIENQAWKEVEDRNWNSASILYEDMINLDKKYYIGWFGKGVCLMRTYDFLQALVYFHIADYLQSDIYSHYQNISYCYFELHRLNLSLKYVNEALRVSNKSIQSLLLKANILESLNDKIGAIQQYSNILTLEPNNKMARDYLLKNTNREWP